MIKILTTLFLIVFCFLRTMDVVFAHILKSNGTIGVVYHLEPDHSPAVGEPATISFTFKDTSNRLKPESCNCIIEIYKGSEKIHTEILFKDLGAATLENQFFQYSFPEKGVYRISVIGEPKLNSDFPSFQLEYDQRVDRVNGEKPVNSNFKTYGIILFGGLMLFITLAAIKSNKNK